MGSDVEVDWRTRPCTGGEAASEGQAVPGGRGRREVAGGVPVRPGQVDDTSSRTEALGDCLTAGNAVVESDGVTSYDITEGTDLTHFDENSAARISAKRHPCFEEHVGAGLRGWQRPSMPDRKAYRCWQSIAAPLAGKPARRPGSRIILASRLASPAWR